MPTSELFLTRTLSDIAPRKQIEKRRIEDLFSRTKRATPNEIFDSAEELMRLFHVTLRRDGENPNAAQYTQPLSVLERPNVALSLRGDVSSEGEKTFTFVALQYEDDNIVAEHDLITYSQIAGKNSNGIETDDELNASAMQALKEMSDELTHAGIISQARRETGVDLEPVTTS